MLPVSMWARRVAIPVKRKSINQVTSTMLLSITMHPPRQGLTPKGGRGMPSVTVIVPAVIMWHTSCPCLFPG